MFQFFHLKQIQNTRPDALYTVHNFYKIYRIGKNGLFEHEIPVLLDARERVRAYSSVDSRVYSAFPFLGGSFYTYH